MTARVYDTFRCRIAVYPRGSVQVVHGPCARSVRGWAQTTGSGRRGWVQREDDRVRLAFGNFCNFASPGGEVKLEWVNHAGEIKTSGYQEIISCHGE